jgi:hypothetical protein
MRHPYFAAADSPLALLGVNYGPQHVGSVGAVGGLDYVGAERAGLVAPGGFGQVMRGAQQLGLQLPPQARQLMPAYAPQAGPMASYGDVKLQALQQLAMSNYVPQIPLGLGDITTKVKANGGTGTFTPEGSVPLRITNIDIPPSIAPFFVITQFTVARLNLLAGGTPVPAETFMPNSRRPPLEFPILAAGSQITIGVTNIDANDHLFFASVHAIDLTSASARMIP